MPVNTFRFTNRWELARRIVQIATLVFFIVLVLIARQRTWPTEIADLPFRLDPLAMIAQAIASRTILAGSTLAFATILLTLVFGRAWCGWLCPLGTTLDLLPLRHKNRVKEAQPVPDSWRKVKSLLLIAILVAAIFTNLSLSIFDPLTIFFRSLTIGLLPALDHIFGALETVFGAVPVLAEPLAGLDNLLRPSVFPLTPSLYGYALLYGLFFIGIIGLNRIAHRFWCRYLCPLGAMLGWISKLAIFRRQVTGECKDCALCARDCPVGTIRADRGYASDPSECTVCMQCLGSCKLKGNAFRATRQPAGWSEYDPSRREALQTFGVALTAVALVGSEPLPTRVNPHYILPPGGLDNDLAAKCIRCGECLRVCPTAGLQPALFEAGWVGMSTPLLVSRLGYCDYSCNACGQTCPVQAIPSLSLEEKRTTVIGLAYIKQNRCIAWSDHQNCIVCQEMCPLPDKAVYLLPGIFTNPDGSPAEVKLPYVNRSLCIGCGICENKCPVRGEAAIRVFTPGTPV
jgi:polyferredoxin/NAD-dependent dihydropyrimidine dehydrogenase PreA subunit